MNMDGEVDAVHQWAVNLLKEHRILQSGAPLTPHHFQRLCSNTSMRQALYNASRRVVTPARCRHIRLNLQLAAFKKSCSGEGGGVSSPEEVARQRARVLEAEAGVATAAAQLASTSVELSNAECELTDGCQRRHLLQAVSAQLVDDTKQCNEQLTLVQAALQQWTSAPSNTQGVEGGVAHVERLRTALLEGEGDQHELKVDLWCRLSGEMRERSGAAVVAGVARLAKKRTADLNRSTADIDLRVDAAKLRLEMTSGGGLRDCAPPGVCSVRTQVSLVCGAHVEAHQRAHRLRHVADQHQTARDDINATLQCAVKHQQCAAGTSAAVLCCISAAGDRAALHAVQALVARLQQAADQANRQQEQLRRLQHRIQDTEDLVLSTQRRLRCLERGIDRCWTGINDHRSTTLQILQQSNNTSAHSLQEHSNTTALQHSSSATSSPTKTPAPDVDTLTQEIDALSLLPMSSLTALIVPGVGHVQQQSLSIRLQSADHPRLQAALDKVCPLSAVLTSESACASVCSAQAQVCALEARARHAENMHELLRKTADTRLPAHAIKELCAHVDESDQTLETGVREVIDTCAGQLKQAEHTLPRAHVALQNWWNQPAKSIKL